ncbi:MAG: SDR family oxidoreductase [Clostridia bacterium]|nr:SDR family oxidoreductase [Deltaproteobacteria bacterium]
MLAIVTGAGVRFGKAIALQLAAAGYELALHANAHAESAEGVAREIIKGGGRARVFVANLECDVARLGAELVAAYPAVDLLVNNAAIFEKTSFERITEAAYQRMQRINIEAPFFLTQALTQALRRARGGVVNVIDVGADRVVPGYAHYTVAKAGLQGLTKALAVELAPEIRVNGVAPGIAAFPEAWDSETRERVLERIPLARSGTPDDVARAVLFLARDASYVSGQIIAVDGAWSTHL